MQNINTDELQIIQNSLRHTEIIGVVHTNRLRLTVIDNVVSIVKIPLGTIDRWQRYCSRNDIFGGVFKYISGEYILIFSASVYLLSTPFPSLFHYGCDQTDCCELDGTLQVSIWISVCKGRVRYGVHNTDYIRCIIVFELTVGRSFANFANTDIRPSQTPWKATLAGVSISYLGGFARKARAIIVYLYRCYHETNWRPFLCNVLYC